MHRSLERGFTLGEVLMVTSLLTFATTGVMKFVSRATHRGPSYEEVFRQWEGKGRGTVDQMVQELRLVGQPAPASIRQSSEVNSANSNLVAASAFLVATPNLVIFEADVNGDGSVERVEYRLNGMVLERSAVSKNPDGSAPAAQYETLAQDVDNGPMPLFTYAGDPFRALAGPGNSNLVRVLLLLRSPAPDPKKKLFRTIGFEGIAQWQAPESGGQEALLQQDPIQGAPLETNSSENPSPMESETAAQRWTLR